MVFLFQHFPSRATLLQRAILTFIALGGMVLRTAAWEATLGEGDDVPSSLLVKKLLSTRSVVELRLVRVLSPCGRSKPL